MYNCDHRVTGLKLMLMISKETTASHLTDALISTRRQITQYVYKDRQRTLV